MEVAQGNCVNFTTDISDLLQNEMSKKTLTLKQIRTYGRVYLRNTS